MSIMLHSSLISSILVTSSFATALVQAFTARQTNNIIFQTKGNSHTQMNSAPPKKRAHDDNYYDIYKPNDNDDENRMRSLNGVIQKRKKSEESSFWYSVKEGTPSAQEEVTPYESKLDTSGDLPFGSYRLLGKQEYEAKRTCLLTIGLDFWNTYKHESQVEIDTDQVLENVHHLIDSGFKSFQLHNINYNSKRNLELSNKYMGASWKQTFLEQNIYHQIVKQTPRSVLKECILSTRMTVPHANNHHPKENDNESSQFTFRESDVRQSIGQSIMNMYGKADGCLDSVQLNFQPSDNNDEIFSPYTLDMLNVLQEMQREGLIRSINGLNFPHYAIDEIEKNGFSLDYNQLTCNLLDPLGYTAFVQNQESEKQIVVSSVLAGGLLTNKFSNIPHSCLNHRGEPIDGYMSPSESWHNNKSLSKVWVPAQKSRNMSRRETTTGWQLFQSQMIKYLEEIAFKHHVSIASVVIRWSIQLDQIGSVVIGSSLNTQSGNNELPFTRPNNLREVFSFELDEDDMDKLWDISGGSRVNAGCINDFYGEDIDFSNKKLWL